MVLRKFRLQVVNGIPVFPALLVKHLLHLLTSLCPDGLIF